MNQSPITVTTPAKLRNIAIIAHVDHGKTTLVDSMFNQSGIYRDNEERQERAMDSHDLERERGITILAKNTAIPYGEYKINILDTPGHADFSGEVERVLTMVDGALLIVDAVEGPMPQTRFVLRKALNWSDHCGGGQQGRSPGRRSGSGRGSGSGSVYRTGGRRAPAGFQGGVCVWIEGTATLNMADPLTDLDPLFKTIIETIPPPPVDPDGPLQLQVSTLDYNDYSGSDCDWPDPPGTIRVGQPVILIQRDGTTQNQRVSKLFGFVGLKRTDITEAHAGDIVAVAGMGEVQIGETITDPTTPEALPLIAIEEPTLQMAFSVNNGPFVGREGEYVTSRQLGDRLYREIKSNVSLRVENKGPDVFSVSGRGELHLSILIETMRREGYEFCVSKPEVITKDIDGQKHEPQSSWFWMSCRIMPAAALRN
ncbi:MAG: GTP-binding protein [Vampirovibrionales bacterium]